jgi:hypothetical protein
MKLRIHVTLTTARLTASISVILQAHVISSSLLKTKECKTKHKNKKQNITAQGMKRK